MLDVNLAKQNAVSGLPAQPDISMVPLECFDYCYIVFECYGALSLRVLDLRECPFSVFVSFAK